MMLILNVVYVLIAIAIIALVLMQRGSGAQAGSGFGAGASGTVFGARGASNFLSKSTKWLAIAFFGITLFMAWHASHSARPTTQQNLGVMTQQQGPSAATPAAGELPAQPTTVPSAPAAQPAPTTVPSAPAQAPTDATSQPGTAQPPVQAPAQGG
nr:preprotein translocase subunit SecG [Pseudoxanthomonas sp.]